MNDGDYTPDIRFAKPVTPEQAHPTIRGPFHGIDMPTDTPCGAFVRNAVEANAASLEEKLRKLKEITGDDPHLFIRAGDRLEEGGHVKDGTKDKLPPITSDQWAAVVDDYLRRIGAEPAKATAKEEPVADWAQRVAGTKHDADKPDAGTVLAGFWPLVKERAIDMGPAQLRPVVVPMSVLDRLFDATVSISKRLTDACALLPLSSLERTLAPGTYGARKKYGQDNWLTVKDGVNRYYQAAGRHTLKMITGEEKDAEGLVHSECVVWCIWAGATHVLKNEEERLKK